MIKVEKIKVGTKITEPVLERLRAYSEFSSRRICYIIEAALNEYLDKMDRRSI